MWWCTLDVLVSSLDDEQVAVLDALDEFYFFVAQFLVERINEYADEIQSEVLAQSITMDTTKGYEKKWNINSEEVILAVEKVM